MAMPSTLLRAVCTSPPRVRSRLAQEAPGLQPWTQARDVQLEAPTQKEQPRWVSGGDGGLDFSESKGF